MKILPLLLALFISISATGATAATPAAITSEPYGKTGDGIPVDVYTLVNTSGMEARITNYGGLIVSLKVPDRHGKMADVVLGYDKLEGYLEGNPFYGAILGRYAGRLGGTIPLDGVPFKLNPLGRSLLHGGWGGLFRKVWTAKMLTTKDGPALQLTCLSKDGDGGFPGNLTVTTTYTLTEKNELRIDYTATTDKPTVLNLSNHSYFNLAGQGEGDTLGHIVAINADKFVELTDSLFPTGKLRDVEGTPLDFRKPFTIGSRIDADYDQLKLAGGYDHCWVINKKPGVLALAARILEPKSGRLLEVLSTEPGMQFYAGVSMSDETGKAGKEYHVHYAFCMEAGHFPDSPNHPEFPSTELKPGEVFQSTIIFRFSTQEGETLAPGF